MTAGPGSRFPAALHAELCEHAAHVVPDGLRAQVKAGGDLGVAQALGQEMKDLLLQAIDGLPPQMRRCVRLRLLQDLDYDEIAEILQLSPSTVKVQLFKARKRLQLELGDALADFEL